MTRVKFLLVFLTVFMIAFGGVSKAQTTIYNQNFNDSSGGIPVGWSNTGSGCTWVSSNVNPSTGYAGASAGRNLYAATCTGSSEITLNNNVSTVAYNNIKVVWGARKAPAEGTIIFEWFDGALWNPVSFTDVANNSTWALVNGGVQISLPAGAAGQTNLKLRWRLTNPVDYRIDDVSIIGTLVVGAPVKLVVISTTSNLCTQFRADKPFTMTIQSQDINGNPSNVTGNTAINLTVFSGSGSLGGTTTGQINSGSSSVSISGILYNTAESGVIIRANGGSLIPGNSAAITFGPNAAQIVFYGVPANGTTNIILPAFGVLGSYGGGQYDSCFSGTVTISQYTPAGNNIHGTLVRISTYAASFNDIYFDAPGVYTIQASCPGYTSVISSPINITNGTPALVELKVPRNMNGSLSTTNNLFNAYLVQLKYLTANATYRYINSAVNGSDGPTSLGAGNVIYPDAVNSFTRTTSPSLSSSYGTFTTDNTGSYTGWFMIEPTSDARFTAGANVKYRIILNDGASGTTPQTYLTTTQQVKVLDWTNTSNGGSFYDISSGTLQAKNFLLAYNGDTSGTAGRPEFINVIESDGLNLSSAPEILTGYKTLVDGQNGHAGIQLPDNLPLGMTLLEERTFSGGLYSNITANGTLRSRATSPNGIWNPGISTINPTNGMTPLSLLPSFILTAIVQNTEVANEFSLGQNYPNPFNPSTMIKFDIPKSALVKLTIYDVLGKEVAVLVNENLTAGTYSAELNASNLPSGVYFYKLTAGDYSATKKMVLIK